MCVYVIASFSYDVFFNVFEALLLRLGCRSSGELELGFY
jgi:hypothetical protein